MTTKPTLGLLSSLTDEHILRALMADRRATRAEIAAVTGLSKPTVSDGVRRLEQAGVVVATGELSTGRGRSGIYYALAPTAGSALVAKVAPEGIVAERIDVHGATLARAEVTVARPAERGDVAAALTAVAADVGLTRLAVISAADPVDRESGRLVALPDSPFMVGELDPVAILADLVDGPIAVDNDINWAARAEPGSDFVYVHLSDGLGGAVVSDGQVLRGHSGLAGEIAHVLTVGPGDRAMPFVDVFGALGLRRERSSAIDVDRLLARTDLHDSIARAVAGVLLAATGLADPSVVLIGGRWGRELLAVIRRAVETSPRQVRVEAATVEEDPSFVAARAAALTQLRNAVIHDRPGSLTAGGYAG